MKKCSKCQTEKEYSEFNKDKSKKDGYRSNCSLCRVASLKKYYLTNKDSIIQYKNEYYAHNIEEILNKKKKYYQANKQEIKKRNMIYNSLRLKNDVNYKLTKTLRTRLSCAIKNNQKTGSAVSDLGCSIEELQQYLEAQFQEGMSWDNHSFYGWHIDHIKALANFDLTNRDELLKACHYTNLQPLWAKDNLSKGNKK